MDSVSILRALWRLRLMVGLIALTSALAGFAVTTKITFPPKLESRGYTVGIATASVLLDTPRSQVVDVSPKGSDTLAARANVLANLMVDGEIKEAITDGVGLPPKRVVAYSQATDGSQPTPTLTARSFALTTKVALTSDMAALPIIRIETQAPDVSRAIKLANAAAEGLSSYLDEKAADETVPDRRRLRVRALGTAQGHEASRGPSRMIGAVVALFMFLAGCGVLLAVTALARGWREAEAFERELGGERLEFDAELPNGGDPDAEWDLTSAPTTELRVS